LPLGDDDGALHPVLELAHVAGPVVAGDRLHGLRTQSPLGSPRFALEPLEEVPGQHQGVVGALAQRGDLDQQLADPWKRSYAAPGSG